MLPEQYRDKIDALALIALNTELVCNLCEAECGKQWEHSVACHARFEALGVLIARKRCEHTDVCHDKRMCLDCGKDMSMHLIDRAEYRRDSDR